MKTVLITGARAPVSRDLALAFTRAGWRAVLADSLYSYAAALSGNRFEHIASPRFDFTRFKDDIAALVYHYEPALILPTCEEVYWLAVAAEGTEWGQRLFAPSFAVLKRLHSKIEFAHVAAEAGLPVPQTWRVSSREELMEFAPRCAELVFKPEFSRFACRVAVRPQTLDTIAPSPQTPWAVQAFVEGDERCLWSAAIDGELVGFAAYKPKWRKGHSAGFYFQAEGDPAYAEVARRVARALHITGQLSFDVIRRADGTILPIECNPRATSGIHLYDAAPALAEALNGSGGFAAPSEAARHLGPAMWIYGAPKALASGRWKDFRRDFAVSRDVLSKGWAGMLLDIAQFVLGGVWHGQSASAFTTRDMEWNSEAIE